MRKLRLLVACESSGTVRDAFNATGKWDAWSCDLLPSSGKHFQCDVLTILDGGWDMIIAHPPCTYLTNSAAWAFTNGPYHQKVKPETLVGARRREARVEALSFVREIWDAPAPLKCIENPIGAITGILGKPSQIIQPFQFGHPESKATCLWLSGLPRLVPTKVLRLPECGHWENQTPSGQNKLGPAKDRWRVRSVTYSGIAKAMAEQWLSPTWCRCG